MKLLGALFLVSLTVSNLRTCEAAGKKKVQVRVHSKGRHHAYGIRRHLDQSQSQTEDMDHFNVTLENNELLHQLLSLINSSSSTCTTAPETKSYPMDCSDIFAEGQTQSGIYKILPKRDQLDQPLSVFCDMEDGGGWTVFLLRNNASEHVNFTRNWNDYKEFFGSADEEYWIGNENLHALTSSDRTYEVRYDAKAQGKSDTWQGWKNFSVASKDDGYRLTIGGFDEQSTVEDSYGFSDNIGMKFSTYDVDNDKADDRSCAEIGNDGWWHNDCSYIYPTGLHDGVVEDKITLVGWSNEYYGAVNPTWIRFKIRPTE